MPRMVWKQVYIESHQETTLKNTLKKQAKSLGITEAEVNRRTIDRPMISIRLGAHDKKAWEREKAFITRRIAKGPISGGRQWKREDAYEERLMRYGR